MLKKLIVMLALVGMLLSVAGTAAAVPSPTGGYMACVKQNDEPTHCVLVAEDGCPVGVRIWANKTCVDAGPTDE